MMPERLLKLTGALLGGLLFYLVNQFIYVATGNIRLTVLIIQSLSLIVVEMLFFKMLLLLVLSYLFVMILLVTNYRLKKDFVW
jgi:hypothetical protein